METVNSDELLQQLNLPPASLTNQAEYIRIVRSGISGGVVKKAIGVLGNRELFVRLLNTTSANINRYYRKKTLNPVDSEEVLDTLRVFIETRSVLGDLDTAREWLSTPIPALAGEKPVSLFDTFEGRNWVRQVLRKIEYGEFS